MPKRWRQFSGNSAALGFALSAGGRHVRDWAEHFRRIGSPFAVDQSAVTEITPGVRAGDDEAALVEIAPSRSAPCATALSKLTSCHSLSEALA